MWVSFLYLSRTLTWQKVLHYLPTLLEPGSLPLTKLQPLHTQLPLPSIRAAEAQGLLCVALSSCLFDNNRAPHTFTLVQWIGVISTFSTGFPLRLPVVPNVSSTLHRPPQHMLRSKGPKKLSPSSSEAPSRLRSLLKWKGNVLPPLSPAQPAPTLLTTQIHLGSDDAPL